jgi:DNA topoisomerase-1
LRIGKVTDSRLELLMSKALLIVESPAKVKTIRRFLGNDYTIESSVGHVKDLPPNRLGVAVEEGFAPEYEVISEKKKVMQKLKKAAQEVDEVYLALDPDREGEAIAWHIAEELQRSRNFKGEIHRVLFHEITKRAIEEALQRPMELNRERFDAQQARRILDRLVGYQISPLLWDKVKRGLSAGRVQSVAVRLVVDRERQIQIFEAEEYWSISTRFEGPTPPIFDSKLIRWKNEKVKLSNGEETQVVVDHLSEQEYVVADVQKKERRRKPSPPFITSKLQQEAARKYNFTARRTMQIAQQLYEGVELGEEGPVGLITYMRTDSTRISEEAIKNVRELIGDRFGQEYLPEKPQEYAKKKRAQDAHEAIRPTYMERDPEQLKEVLTREQHLLYSLIWKRFVACQMVPAIYDQTVVDIKAGEGTFRSSGQIMRFDGYTKVYNQGKAEQDLNAKMQMDAESNVESSTGLKLPALEVGDVLTTEGIKPQQHFTQPPKRFSESTLVKELEEQGIGRPSTYASILSVIQDKSYVEKKEGRFRPTELGFLVTDLLVKHFPRVLNVEFTAGMEEDLDKVELGEQDWVALLGEFHTPFQETLTKAQDEMQNIKKEGQLTDLVCEKCNSPMVIKWGRNGQFLACSAYPECKNTKDFERNDRGKIVVKEPTEDELEAAGTCPCEHEAPMIVKTGKFGRFLACSRYPECKVTMPFKVGVPCPREGCGGDLVEKRSRKGKLFYSCSNYPDCDYALWDRPIPEACPSCEHPLLVEAVKKRKNRPAGIYCPECNYRKEEDAPAEPQD